MEKQCCYPIPEGVQEHKTKNRNSSLQFEGVNVHKHVPIVIQKYTCVLHFVAVFCCCKILQPCISTEIPSTLDVFPLKKKKKSCFLKHKYA